MRISVETQRMSKSSRNRPRTLTRNRAVVARVVDAAGEGGRSAVIYIPSPACAVGESGGPGAAGWGRVSVPERVKSGTRLRGKQTPREQDGTPGCLVATAPRPLIHATHKGASRRAPTLPPPLSQKKGEICRK